VEKRQINMINSQEIPHLIKYMGSKREILDDIGLAIETLGVTSEWFCDLFAGTSIVSCALKNQFNIQSNDIQEYSSIFAHTYFLNLDKAIKKTVIEEIHEKVLVLVNEFCIKYPELNFDYATIEQFDDLRALEVAQQKLIDQEFEIGFSLFTRYYSGTYWSFNQCIWIDSIRAVAEEYKGEAEYYAILSALIFAMSYTTQSTGHFAQYRDVTESNMHDILLYRNKDIWSLFSRKFEELINTLNVSSKKEYKITTLDYTDCLRIIEENTIVYADPPYSAVHYSRFYHAIETLVKYDHPIIKYKGRYRDDRHQSPFDKKTEVSSAFKLLFENVKLKSSHLILSYSDNGMISQKEILQIGKSIFGKDYDCNLKTKEYIHSKMGRSDEYQMDVNELIITYRKK
jgi:adenine-specific DNA-methyltransferase